VPTDHIDDADFLEEIIEERATKNPAFPVMVEEAYQRRLLLRRITEARKAAHLSRTTVAARMNTSESAVARLEAAAVDPKLSTLERYAAAVGKQIRWELVDANR
jgi:ribosome-binding protein aMBF1 (putative translation factor)